MSKIIALGTLRYTCALTLGLLLIISLFTTLRNVTNPVFESHAVIATQIEFIRPRPGPPNENQYANANPEVELMEVPAIPQVEFIMATRTLSMLPTVMPTIDVRAAIREASTASHYQSEVIAMLRIPPSYPGPARLAKIQGYVTMEVAISPEGNVTEVAVVDAAPPRMFDNAAMNAMKRWKFRPKFVNGVPVSQRAHQTIEFKIGEG